MTASIIGISVLVMVFVCAYLLFPEFKAKVHGWTPGTLHQAECKFSNGNFEQKTFSNCRGESVFAYREKK